ncbi:hypothetical protein Y695_04112 [Hydrogenophaga sp. T4]|nr:hypothetical protein Y695_04112 [Hydrogenophaga sp. T4]
MQDIGRPGPENALGTVSRSPFLGRAMLMRFCRQPFGMGMLRRGHRGRRGLDFLSLIDLGRKNNGHGLPLLHA